MTREEIINHGVTPDIARAVADFLKTNLPIGHRIADPTAIVNNEGAMVGWTRAAEAIEALATPLEQQGPTKSMYSEPPTRQ